MPFYILTQSATRKQNGSVMLRISIYFSTHADETHTQKSCWIYTTVFAHSIEQKKLLFSITGSSLCLSVCLFFSRRMNYCVDMQYVFAQLLSSSSWNFPCTVLNYRHSLHRCTLSNCTIHSKNLPVEIVHRKGWFREAFRVEKRVANRDSSKQCKSRTAFG